MRDTVVSAAMPAAKCRNCRRGSLSMVVPSQSKYVRAGYPYTACRHGLASANGPQRKPRLLHLLHAQCSPIAARPQKPARHRAGVLTALEDRSASNKRRFVAIDALHEAAAAGRHVVDQLGLVEPQAVEVDQVYVGA